MPKAVDVFIEIFRYIIIRNNIQIYTCLTQLKLNIICSVVRTQSI